jgi:hypothetical protein
LGTGKRGSNVTEAQTRKDLGEMQQLPGMGAAGLMPPGVKEMICQAEQLKLRHKGL